MKMDNGSVFVNATEMAKSFNTQTGNWLRTEQSQRIINALSETHFCASTDLVQVTKGGDLKEQGTWMHEDVALAFAQWLSPEFYILCNRKIKELLRNGYAKLDTISKKDLAKMLLESEEEKEKMQLTIDSQSKELIESAPKVEYFNKCLESKGFLTTNMIAAELGISSIKLNKLLCGWGIQYKQSDCYFLYADYRDKGYTVHRPYPHLNSQGITVTTQHMYWTESGKRFIIEMYNKKIAA